MHCTLHVHAQCKFIYIYMYYTATWISPCANICEQCVNIHVGVSVCELFNMCQHLLTMCEHACICQHVCLNCFIIYILYPVYPCTM